jgi:prepilin-type processing-associated H-X9-DG protein
MIYDAAAGEVKPGNSLPPRPAGAMWSPDGRRCAYLMDSGEAKSKQLIICQTEAVSAPPVPLPGLKLKQVLGWSPDGNLVLALDEKGTLYTVSARAPDEAAMAAVAKDYTKDRAAAVDAVVIPAGPPSWSSSGEFLAYVMADENDPEYAWVKAFVKRTKRPMYVPFNKLTVMQCAREYIGPGPKTEREQIVFNMKKIAIAVQMYATDYDRFPPTDDVSRIRDILDEYIGDRTAFLRPGSEDDVIVKYLLPPGISFRDALQDKEANTVQVAIVEYPTYTVIAYADGHVETVQRK